MRSFNSIATLCVIICLMIAGLPLVASQSKTTDTPPAPTTTPSATYDCPCNLWGTAVPRTKNYQDASGLEVGLKFQSLIDGYVTGVRFHKGSANTGTHTGHLWTSDGKLLAEATFKDETASGWQEASFETPVAISAKTTYVISYFSSTGWYSVDRPNFSQNIIHGPLVALKSKGNGGNGVYVYNGKPYFPNKSFQSSNYWVDVIFVTTLTSEAAPEATPEVTETPVGG